MQPIVDEFLEPRFKIKKKRFRFYLPTVTCFVDKINQEKKKEENK